MAREVTGFETSVIGCSAEACIEKLGNLGVELYFSSGKVLERLREYYAR
ncbi:MAG TPA: hypothetical protein EYP22_06630 [Methanosarcinales archaeon]|nr:hypothetical protein [Methanosarcinales archaeon]